MNNNEKKFSLENFKKNVKQHKVKFILNCVFIVLSVFLLIFLSVLSFSNKKTESASALSNESRAYQYPEFGPSSNIFINSQSPYFVPYFTPNPSTTSCSVFIALRETSSSIRDIYISSFYILPVSSVNFSLRYNGKYLNNNVPINGGSLLSMTKDGDNFRCVPSVQAYCVILNNPSYLPGNRILYQLLPEIPVYNTIYNNGVSDGYDSGYESGSSSSYDLGYSSGYNTALTNGLKNPVSFIIDPVREFLNAPLFGVVSVGSVLTVALFVLVAIMFIKMFAGG